MMFSISKKLFISTLILGVIVIFSCVDDDDFSTPPIICENNFQASLALNEVFALNVTSGPDEIQVATDSIFEGYVVSSDEAGNFFSTLVLQDRLSDPTRGLQVNIDLRDYYTRYPLGSRVLVNVNGLFINNDTGPLALGGTFDDDGVLRVGRLAEFFVNQHVFRSCDSLQIPTPRTFNGITEDLFQAENLNTLVKIENVQFESAGNGETFFDPANEIGGATNVNLIDFTNNSTLALRTSEFTDFANEELPSGRGSIVGILSAFGDSTPSPSEYQFFIRDLDDIMFDDDRSEACEFAPTPNASIPDVVALNTTDSPDEITDEIFFDGYVISSDQAGNFFKTISLQNEIENPTAGLQVELDDENLFADFPVGSHVVVSAQGLFVDNDRGVIKVGQTFNSSGTLRVGRVEESLVPDVIERTCDDVSIIVPTTYNGIDDAIFSADNLNTLIRIDGVQFQSALNGETYFDNDNSTGGATNVVLEDQQGRTIVLRNSSFADFAEQQLPSGSGSITAVLSAFDFDEMGFPSNSEFQLFIRDLNDVEITDNPDDRFAEICDPVTIPNQTVPFTDDFESYNEGDFELPWTTYNEEGSRAFDVREFGGNQYANMSAFNSGEVNITWLISPRMNIDNMTDKVMSFTMQDAFQNGNPLRLLFSQDYDGSDCPTNFTWTEIGATEIAALINNSGSFDGVFSPSGDIDLSSISGEAVFAFVYSGEDNVLTTTVQIDDVNFGILQGSGGTSISLLSEDFETTNDDVDINLSGWVNVDEDGNLPIWQGDSFGGNRYAIANAFSDQSPTTPMNIWLITPAIDLDATTNEELIFDYQQNFYNGDVLTVLYSTNYDGTSTNPQDFTWIDVTAEADATENNPSGFMSGFASSNPVDLSSVNGDVYIAFVYRANNTAGLTTRLHLDNIEVSGDQ